MGFEMSRRWRKILISEIELHNIPEIPETRSRHDQLMSRPIASVFLAHENFPTDAFLFFSLSMFIYVRKLLHKKDDELDKVQQKYLAWEPSLPVRPMWFKHCD